MKLNDVIHHNGHGDVHSHDHSHEAHQHSIEHSHEMHTHEVHSHEHDSGAVLQHEHHEHTQDHDQAHDANHIHGHAHETNQEEADDDMGFDLLAQLQSIEHHAEALPIPTQHQPLEHIPDLHHLLAINTHSPAAFSDGQHMTPVDQYNNVPVLQHSISTQSFNQSYYKQDSSPMSPHSYSQPQRSMSTNSVLNSLGYSGLDGPITRDQANYCSSILSNLKKNRLAQAFLEPVDPIRMGIPHYRNIIDSPMDLGTVAQKLNRRQYPDLASFVKDVNLIFQNCYRFNGPNSEYSHNAKALEDQFNHMMRNMPRTDQHSGFAAASIYSQSSDDFDQPKVCSNRLKCAGLT
jgi:hypothetical protein